MLFHLRNLLFWIAVPLLIPQALYVRKTAPRFAPADGPSIGTVGEGNAKKLLAVGDSIIAGVGASTLSRALVGQTATALADSQDCQVEWQALGVSGYNSAKILKQLIPQLPSDAVDYIIVSVGVNDITGLTPLFKWRRNYARLLDELRAHSPNARIAVTGMPPLHGFPLLPQPLRAVFGMRSRSFEHLARQIVAERPNVEHVPVDFNPDPEQFAGDGYHPSEESYQIFGRSMAEGLSEEIKTINR
jgi:lysophospholipase L1-like esterase